MNKSFFGLPSLMQEIRSKLKEMEIIQEYEKTFGPIVETNVNDNAFYKEGLASFDTGRLSTIGPVQFPGCMEDEPEGVRDFFLRLVMASTISAYHLTMHEKDIILSIEVKHKDEKGRMRSAKTNIDELTTYQVLFLMSSYLAEQLHMSVEGIDRPNATRKKRSRLEKKYNDALQSLARQTDIRRGGFRDVAGMEALKDKLSKRIIWVLKDKEKAEKYHLAAPNGMVLYGPPGCGKTYFAQKFAEESGFNYRLVNGSDLGSVYIHGTQMNIAEIFKDAEKSAPTIICFDEFDSFVPSRGIDLSASRAEEVNEFLSQLNNCSQRGIFIIGTTNRLDMIDPAVLRRGRIDMKVEIPAPDAETRRQLFTLYMKGRPQEEDIDIDRLAQLTDGYASSDIAYLVNEAALEAALGDRPISYGDLENAVKDNPSSLDADKARRKIGFNT